MHDQGSSARGRGSRPTGRRRPYGPVRPRTAHESGTGLRFAVAFLAGTAAVAAATGPGAAEEGAQAPERGQAIALEMCAGCHAVGADDASPLPAAPPFRTLHERYPVSDLEEALAEGMVTGHEAMPEVALPPDEVAAFIAYLESLAPAATD